MWESLAELLTSLRDLVNEDGVDFLLALVKHILEVLKSDFTREVNSWRISGVISKLMMVGGLESVWET